MFCQNVNKMKGSQTLQNRRARLVRTRSQLLLKTTKVRSVRSAVPSRTDLAVVDLIVVDKDNFICTQVYSWYMMEHYYHEGPNFSPVTSKSCLMSTELILTVIWYRRQLFNFANFVPLKFVCFIRSMQMKLHKNKTIGCVWMNGMTFWSQS